MSSNFEIGVQFFHGRVTGADNFTYWMFGFQLGVLPLGSMELSQLRVLAVKNMTPRLDPPGDSTAQEMRLLRWFKREGDALSLRLDRKLAAWMPLDASLAGGVGASLTLAGTKAVRDRALRLRVRLAGRKRRSHRPRAVPREVEGSDRVRRTRVGPRDRQVGARDRPQSVARQAAR